MKRLECLSLLGPLIKDDDLVHHVLGQVAGEWFAVRHKESNLYQVNMGMCTPLCLGLALVLPHRVVSSRSIRRQRASEFRRHDHSGKQTAAQSHGDRL